MTIGEKIKTYRKYRGITQDELAKLSGIHPVSIRKYETDKMEPQPQQIEKIANALNISYSALGDSYTISRMETVGDLVGLILILAKTNILEFVGEKNIYGFIHSKTSLKLNDIIAKNFSVSINDEPVEFKNLLFKLNHLEEFEDLVTWANLYSLLLKEKSPSHCEELKNSLEILEIRLQKSTIKLSELANLK